MSIFKVCAFGRAEHLLGLLLNFISSLADLDYRGSIRNADVYISYTEAREFFENVKSRIDDIAIYDTLKCVFTDFLNDRIEVEEVVETVRSILKNHQHIFSLFSRFLPDKFKSGMVGYTDANDFVQRIRKEAPEIYEAFIETLKDFDSKVIGLQEVYDRVTQCMKNYPELMKEFRRYIPENNEIEGSEMLDSEEEGRSLRVPQNAVLHLQLPGKKKKSKFKGDTQNEMLGDKAGGAFGLSDVEEGGKGVSKNEYMFFGKLKYGLHSVNEYNDIMKLIDIYTLGIINYYECIELLEGYFEGYEDTLENLKHLLKSREIRRRQESWMCKPLSKVNISSWNRMGSYMEIPEYVPTPVCTGRTFKKLKMNDQWVSIPQGSEDFSYKKLRKNIYEEQLFKCEDDRYELDMKIGYFGPTLELLEELYKQFLEDSNMSEIPRDRLTRLNTKAISKIYVEHEQEIIDLLVKNPQKAFPVVIDRLKEKRDLMLVHKREASKQWNETCEKNFYKSLDHRSFIFKQNEKKNMNLKAFMNEIKEQKTEKLKMRRLPEGLVNYNILKGGTEFTTYFSTIPPITDAPNRPQDMKILDADPLNSLSNEDLKRFCEKTPDIQLSFQDEEMLQESIQMLLYSIQIYHCGATEKERMIKFLINILKNVLDFQITEEMEKYSPEVLDEEVLKSVQTEGFWMKRYNRMGDEMPSILQEMMQSSKELEDESEIPSYMETRKPGANTKLPNKLNKVRVHKKIGNIDKSSLSYDPCAPFGHKKSIRLVKPTQKDIQGALFLPISSDESPPVVMYATLHFYSFFRMFYCLYERLLKSRELVEDKFKEEYQEFVKEHSSEKQEEFMNHYDQLARERYEDIFIRGVVSFLNNDIEQAKYEDFCRYLLGNQAYLLFTLDKLINQINKTLQQHLINEEISLRLMNLFIMHSSLPHLQETIYKQQYDTLVFELSSQNPSQTPNNTFRLSFNKSIGVLSIYYYNSAYQNLDQRGLAILNSYIRTFIRDKGEEDWMGISLRPRTYLQRNMNKINQLRNLKNDHLIISNRIVNKVGENCRRLSYKAGGENAIIRLGKRVYDEGHCQQTSMLKSMNFRHWCLMNIESQINTN